MRNVCALRYSCLVLGIDQGKAKALVITGEETPLWDAKRLSEHLSNIVQPIYLPRFEMESLLGPNITHALNTSQAIQSLVDQVRLPTPSMMEQIATMTASMVDTTRVATAALSISQDLVDAFQASNLLSDYARSITETLQAFAPAEIDHETVVAAFRAAGWPLTPSMSLAVIRRVIQLHREGKSRYASQAIMAFYRKNNSSMLVETVNDWQSKPYFAPRMHILADALSAHLDRKYTLSVPAALAQLEGIASEYAHASGLTAKLGKPMEVCRAVVGAAGGRGVYVASVIETLLHLLENNTYESSDFRKELRRQSIGRRNTRHTILHGITHAYHRESVSLRAFLLLDALSFLDPFRT